MKFEYKVIPAPKKARKVKGLKRGDDRFAASLMQLMNELGAQGWEYQRTDTLPVESRSGLTSRSTTFQNMLIFRRVIKEVDDTPEAVAAPEATVFTAPAPEAEPLAPAAPADHLAPDISAPQDVAAQ